MLPRTQEESYSDAVAFYMRRTWFVYLLRCGDGSLYCGATTDVGRRVSQHGAGKGGAYTRSHLPVALAYFERCGSRGKALQREIAIKKLSREGKEGLIKKNDH